MSDGGVVVVTLPEIYDDVKSVKAELGGMNAKLDKFIQLNERLDSHKSDIADHESRLRKVEIQVGAQWVVVGIVITGLAAFAGRALFGG